MAVKAFSTVVCLGSVVVLITITQWHIHIFVDIHSYFESDYSGRSADDNGLTGSWGIAGKQNGASLWMK